jgi:predicted naringenin-chalcone synthase
MSFINQIGLANPDNVHYQSAIAEYMISRLDTATAGFSAEQLKALYSRSSIEKRYAVYADFSDIIFELNGRTHLIEEKMYRWKMNAPPLAIAAIEKCLDNTAYNPNQITHLITVSCTGMAAPGLDIMLVQQLGFSNNIWRTSVNFMGCYAAFHALKIADLICQQHRNAAVLVVCIELCSLHFQTSQSADALLSNLLFGDGAAAVLITNHQYNSQKQIKLLGFNSEILFEGIDAMSWEIGSTSFIMGLSPSVPDIIEKNKAQLTHLFGIGLKNNLLWAIHPGGRKILDTVAKLWELTDMQIKPSRKILAEYGNMSSPTVLFILAEILNNPIYYNDSNKGIAVGFGPGITTEVFHFEIC